MNLLLHFENFHRPESQVTGLNGPRGHSGTFWKGSSVCRLTPRETQTRPTFPGRAVGDASTCRFNIAPAQCLPTRLGKFRKERERSKNIGFPFSVYHQLGFLFINE